MADEPVKSCRVYIRYASGSSDHYPTVDDIKERFSAHGNIVDVDRRKKFCFVEYDDEASAEKAVGTENGANFNGINLEVEIAMGARKVRNTSNDTSNTSTAGTEKKSSFSRDKWFAQREMATKIPVVVSESDKVSVPVSVGPASDSTRPAWTSPNWNKTPENSTHLGAEALKQPQTRSRSRSPLTNAQSSAQTHSRASVDQRSQYLQMDQLRRLELELEQQSKRHSASLMSSAESTRLGAKPSTFADVASSRLGSTQQRPLKPALQQSSTLSAPVEAYSTGRDGHRELGYSTGRSSHRELNSTPRVTSVAGGQCEIFISTTNLSDYAKQVAVPIERIGLLVHISVVSAGSIMDEVSGAMSRGCLYALSITGPQVNLYILHGEPEEHRNMLTEDALRMIAKSFADYCYRRQTKRSSGESTSSLPLSNTQPASVAVPRLVAERLQPDTATRRLIGLLSADYELTHSELEHIISYLRLRQKALVSAALPASSSGREVVLGRTDRGVSDRGATDRGASVGRSAGNVVADLDFVNSLLLEAAKFASRR